MNSRSKNANISSSAQVPLLKNRRKLRAKKGGKGGKGGSSVEGNEAQGIKNTNDWTCFDCGSIYHLRGYPV